MEYTKDNIADLVRGFEFPADFDLEQSVEAQTDKQAVKVVPCKECKRPLVVTTFFAPAKALCSPCKGEEGSIASVAKPEPGTTDPAKAVNLAECLLNPSFAHAHCPIDPEHQMELKNVAHSPHYGPTKFLGFDSKGQPRYDVQKGESVIHQCLDCNTVVSYSNQHPGQYHRQNEVKQRTSSPPAWVAILGVREDPPAAEDEAA